MIARNHMSLYSARTSSLRTCTRCTIAPLRTSQRQQSRAVSTCHAQNASEFPANLQKIVGAFQMVPDPMARYKQLLFFATKLPPMRAEDYISENKVDGCVSQVWVVPELRADGKVYWRADSNAQITKGLAALLVLGLSGCTPVEILSVQPTFIELLGLKQNLTPSRNNGFLNMFRLMQRKTLELVAASAPSETAAQVATDSSNGNGNHAEAAVTSTPAADSTPTPAAIPTPAPAAAPAADPEGSSMTPVQDGIRRKLTEVLQPTVLNIFNDSAQHSGHAGAMVARHGKAGETGETHFRVEVVSESFEGMTQVKRQRRIYQLLEEEFGMGLHALSLVTKTPAEAEAAKTRS